MHHRRQVHADRAIGARRKRPRERARPARHVDGGRFSHAGQAIGGAVGKALGFRLARDADVLREHIRGGGIAFANFVQGSGLYSWVFAPFLGGTGFSLYGSDVLSYKRKAHRLKPVPPKATRMSNC